MPKRKAKAKPKAKKAAKAKTRPLKATKKALARPKHKAAKPAKPTKKPLQRKKQKIQQPKAMPQARQARTQLSGPANLLVTYDPNHKGIAEAEIKEAFGIIGEKYELVQTEVEGLFKLRTEDPRRVIRKLTDVSKREKQLLSTTHRYIPVDTWCAAEVNEMQRTIRQLLPRIANEEKWKMSLSKRHWDKMHGTDLIVKLTDIVDKPKVDLEEPDKIIQVEIIGNETGVSILKPDELLDVLTSKA